MTQDFVPLPEEMQDLLTGDPGDNNGYGGAAGQYGDSFEKIETRLADGEKMVFSKPWFLNIDLDSQEAFGVYKSRISSFSTTIGFIEDFALPSPSGRGFHVYVLLREDSSIPERIAMQAILGSDPVREQLSLYKYLRGERTTADDDYKKNPSWLFEKDPSLLPDWTRPDWKRPVADIDKPF